LSIEFQDFNSNQCEWLVLGAKSTRFMQCHRESSNPNPKWPPRCRGVGADIENTLSYCAPGPLC